MNESPLLCTLHSCRTFITKKQTGRPYVRPPLSVYTHYINLIFITYWFIYHIINLPNETIISKLHLNEKKNLFFFYGSIHLNFYYTLHYLLLHPFLVININLYHLNTSNTFFISVVFHHYPKLW